MSYTYCSNCADAVCTCGEKYEGMEAKELTALIAVLTDLRDKRVKADNTPVDPEAARLWRRQQQQEFRSSNPIPPT